MGSELREVAAEVADRLRHRGITVSENERPEELADLLIAVERFEAEVRARGGDLMVDDLKSSEPDDSHFVLPARGEGEPLRDYVARIDQAAMQLRNHPDISAPDISA
jgi:broad specificity phosphatase PhoE